MFSDSDGAQGPSMPSVPCPIATTRQPPGGAAPAGVNTEPDTTVGCPVSPLVDRYSTRAARRSPASTRRVTPGMVVADTRVPGPLPLRSAVLTAAGAPPEDGKRFRYATPTGTANG